MEIETPGQEKTRVNLRGRGTGILMATETLQGGRNQPLFFIQGNISGPVPHP